MAYRGNPVDSRIRCTTSGKNPTCQGSVGTLVSDVVKYTNFNVGPIDMTVNGGQNFTKFIFTQLINNPNTITMTTFTDEIGVSVAQVPNSTEYGLVLPPGLYTFQYTFLFVPDDGSTGVQIQTSSFVVASGNVVNSPPTYKDYNYSGLVMSNFIGGSDSVPSSVTQVLRVENSYQPIILGASVYNQTGTQKLMENCIAFVYIAKLR